MIRRRMSRCLQEEEEKQQKEKPQDGIIRDYVRYLYNKFHLIINFLYNSLSRSLIYFDLSINQPPPTNYKVSLKMNMEMN